MTKLVGLTEEEVEEEVDLIRYLIKRGKIQQVTQAQMYQARHKYIMEGKDERTIAKEIRLTPDIIRAWAVQFDWKEERNRILFSRFCNLQKLKERKAQGLDERHDRIASSIEDQLEDIINRNANGEVELAPKDIGVLARALGQLQTVRRTNHKMNTINVEKNITETRVLDTGDNFNAMVGMLEGIFGKGKINLDTIQPLAITDNEVEEIKDSLDAEYVVVHENK